MGRPQSWNEIVNFEAVETTEFAAVEQGPERFLTVELGPGRAISALTIDGRSELVDQVELRFGRSPETPPCRLIRGLGIPQLDAEWILVQPDVVRRDPARGWLPLGGRFLGSAVVGRAYTPMFEFGADVSREQLRIGASEHGQLELSDHTSRNGTTMVVPEALIRTLATDLPPSVS